MTGISWLKTQYLGCTHDHKFGTSHDKITQILIFRKIWPFGTICPKIFPRLGVCPYGVFGRSSWLRLKTAEKLQETVENLENCGPQFFLPLNGPHAGLQIAIRKAMLPELQGIEKGINLLISIKKTAKRGSELEYNKHS